MDRHDNISFLTIHPGSLLQKDCAVCKDDFEISQETIELPCKHVFHEECILPWIKQSGTCPVCRFELVPQPKHAPGAGGAGGAGNGSGSRGGGLFAALRSASSSDNSQRGAPRNVPGSWHDID